MSMAREIQGVPMRAGIPGLTRAVRSERSSGGALSRMRWESAIGALFGERIYPPFRDDSQLSKRGPRDFLGWSEVDEKRDAHTLIEFSQTATQSMLNENAGLPFLFLATELVISWEYHWTTIWTEIYNVSWAEVGPEGIGRETKWKSWSEQGSTRRFAHQFTVPNEALVDPDFGIDTLRHGLEGVVQTALFTIMTETSIGLATRAMYQEHQARVRNDAVGNYTFADYYDRQTAYFLKAATDVNMATSMITRHLHGENGSSTPKNLLLYPDGSEYYLADLPRELRAFPSKIIDETEEAYIFGQRMKEMSVRPNIVMKGPLEENTALCKIPTWKRTRDEPEWKAIQPLRRRLTLAHAYRFPTVPPPEAVEDKLHYNHFAIAVHRLEAGKPGKFEKVWLDVGIEESLCGGMFKDKDSPEPSDELLAFLEAIEKGKHGDLDKLRSSARRLVDADDLSLEAEESINEGKKFFKYHRSLPWNLRFRDSGDIDYARTIGETMDHLLHTRRLFSYARHIASLGAGTAPFLTRLLGLSANEAMAVANFDHPVPIAGPTFERDLATFFAAALGENVGRHAPEGRAAAASGAPATLVDRLRAVLPDRSLEALGQLAPVLEQLATEQPAAADKLVATLEEKIRGYGDDVGTIDYVVKQAIGKLNAKGLSADATTAGSQLPALTDALIGSIKKLAVPMADSASVTFRAELDSSPEWSSRRAYASSATPLGAGVAEDAMDLDAAAPLGARFPVRSADGTMTNVGVDQTRVDKLRQIVPTASPVEVGILVRLLRTPLTPHNIAHFLRCGIQLINAHATRFRESVLTGNIVSLRGAGETVRVLMTPLMVSVTQRGVVGGTDMTFRMTHGLHWIDPFGVSEMPAFFPGRVLHGFNTKWIKGNKETGTTCVQELAHQIAGLANPLTAADMMCVTLPITETHIDTPIHALIHLPPVANVPGGLRSTVNNRCSGYYTLLQMLRVHGFSDTIARLETVVTSEYTNGDDIHFSPLVEFSPTFHYDPQSGRWRAPISGSGPRGDDIMRGAWALGQILNGAAKHFPSVPAEDAGF